MLEYPRLQRSAPSGSEGAKGPEGILNHVDIMMFQCLANLDNSNAYVATNKTLAICKRDSKCPGLLECLL